MGKFWILIGTLFLILFLLFLHYLRIKRLKVRAMGALANAAIDILVEAFNKYVGGEVFGIKFLEELGIFAGGLGGVLSTGLTALAIGVSPVSCKCLWWHGSLHQVSSRGTLSVTL